MYKAAAEALTMVYSQLNAVGGHNKVTLPCSYKHSIQDLIIVASKLKVHLFSLFVSVDNHTIFESQKHSPRHRPLNTSFIQNGISVMQIHLSNTYMYVVNNFWSFIASTHTFIHTHTHMNARMRKHNASVVQ